MNNRPVIGILAQPIDPSKATPTHHSYIAASYVKFLEGAGARVVPVPYDLPKQELQNLFHSLNGILFPGGGTGLNHTLYENVMKLFVDMSMQPGVFFPIWATCLGFEGLVIAASGEYKVLHYGFDSHNISMPLNFYPSADKVRQESKLFGKENMPSDIMFNTFRKEPVTMNNHVAGIRTSTWFNNAKLTKLFRVLSTNKDRKGQEFISTIEAYDYPVYGSQWHPEKVSYEWWDKENINHSYSSVLANQHMANFFVNECRKNTHQFKNNTELVDKWLIYNHKPVYTFKNNPGFVQTYYFPKHGAASS